MVYGQTHVAQDTGMLGSPKGVPCKALKPLHNGYPTKAPNMAMRVHSAKAVAKSSQKQGHLQKRSVYTTRIVMRTVYDTSAIAQTHRYKSCFFICGHGCTYVCWRFSITEAQHAATRTTQLDFQAAGCSGVNCGIAIPVLRTSTKTPHKAAGNAGLVQPFGLRMGHHRLSKTY